MLYCKDCGCKLDFEGYCPGQGAHKTIKELKEWNVSLVRDVFEMSELVESLRKAKAEARILINFLQAYSKFDDNGEVIAAAKKWMENFK